jgi:hypothetical protein
MQMSRRSREKGRRGELATVRLLQDAGFAAEKASRSGYTGHDISIPLLGRDLRIEHKIRANAFREIYGWLDGGANLLIIRSDRRGALAVVPLRLAIEIAQAAERAK